MGRSGKQVQMTLFVHLDPQIEQLEIAAAVIQVDGRVIEPVLIRHDIDAIPLLVGDQCMEGDVILCFFLAHQVASGVGGACFQRKTVGGPDGGKVGL